MDENLMQTRDVPGAQIRRQARDADVVRIIRDGRLPVEQRTLLVEYVNAAHVHDTRSELGGARFLQGAAHEMPDLPRLRQTVAQLATAFVHPDLRAKGSR